MELKVYYWDLGWRGSVCVIASSFEAAIEKAKTYQNWEEADNYQKEQPEIHEIVDGLVVWNIGDL